jgi:hypothetical protein
MRMPIHMLIEGRVVKRGTRLFAVPKDLSLTDRIANTTQCRGNWSQLPQHGTTARVVRNYK